MAEFGSFAGGLARGLETGLPVYKALKDSRTQDEELKLKKQQLESEVKLKNFSIIAEVSKNPEMSQVYLNMLPEEERKSGSVLAKSLTALGEKHQVNLDNIFNTLSPEQKVSVWNDYKAGNLESMKQWDKYFQQVSANKYVGALLGEAAENQKEAQSTYGAARPVAGLGKAPTTEEAQNAQTFAGASNYLKGVSDKGIELDGKVLAAKYHQIYLKAVTDGRANPEYLKAIKEFIDELKGSPSVIIDKEGTIFSFDKNTGKLTQLNSPASIAQAARQGEATIEQTKAATEAQKSATRINEAEAGLNRGIKHETRHELAEKVRRLGLENDSLELKAKYEKITGRPIDKEIYEEAHKLSQTLSAYINSTYSEGLQMSAKQFQKKLDSDPKAQGMIKGISDLLGLSNVSSVDTMVADVRKELKGAPWSGVNAATKQKFYTSNNLTPEQILEFNKLMSK